MWLKKWAGITRPSVRKANLERSIWQPSFQVMTIETPFRTQQVGATSGNTSPFCVSSGTISTGHGCFGVFPLAWFDTSNNPIFKENHPAEPPSLKEFWYPLIFEKPIAFTAKRNSETSNFHRCSDHAPWIPPCRGVPPPRPMRRRPALERGDPHHCRCHRSWRWPICPSSCDLPSPSELQELEVIGDGKSGGWILWGEGIHCNQDDYGLQLDVWRCHYPAESMSRLLFAYEHLRIHYICLRNPAPLMGELDR